MSFQWSDTKDLGSGGSEGNGDLIELKRLGGGTFGVVYLHTLYPQLLCSARNGSITLAPVPAIAAGVHKITTVKFNFVVASFLQVLPLQIKACRNGSETLYFFMGSYSTLSVRMGWDGNKSVWGVRISPCHGECSTGTSAILLN